LAGFVDEDLLDDDDDGLRLLPPTLFRLLLFDRLRPLVLVRPLLTDLPLRLVASADGGMVYGMPLLSKNQSKARKILPALCL